MKQTNYNPKKLMFLMMLFIASPFLLFAQTMQVKGKVVDAVNSNPIDGASITVKKSTAGTTTDGKGEFSIDVPKGEKVTISYSGYQDQSINATNDFVTVQLSQITKQLEDVVVTAL
jgi:CarboxypepD_reg-like domain